VKSKILKGQRQRRRCQRSAQQRHERVRQLDGQSTNGKHENSNEVWNPLRPCRWERGRAPRCDEFVGQTEALGPLHFDLGLAVGVGGALAGRGVKGALAARNLAWLLTTALFDLRRCRLRTNPSASRKGLGVWSGRRDNRDLDE
jgi:hypothetical protein